MSVYDVICVEAALTALVILGMVFEADVALWERKVWRFIRALWKAICWELYDRFARREVEAMEAREHVR